MLIVCVGTANWNWFSVAVFYTVDVPTVDKELYSMYPMNSLTVHMFGSLVQPNTSCIHQTSPTPIK